MTTLFKFTFVHAIKQVEAFSHAPASERAHCSGLGRSPFLRRNYISGLIVDVCQTSFYEGNGELKEFSEIIRSIEFAIIPAESKPMNIFLNRINIFNILLYGIGIVEPEVAKTPEFSRKPEIKAYGFGMSDVKIAVGFGWKTCKNLPPVFPALYIIGNDVTNKIWRDLGFDAIHLIALRLSLGTALPPILI